jgi:tripartite ATP-independent transporter DctP family solute receptor
MSRLRVRMAIGIVAGVWLAACTGTASGQEVLKLRFGMADNLNNPFGLAMQSMADEVAKRSKGTMEVQIFHSGQVGGEVEILGQVRSGNLDGALLGVAAVSTLEPSLSVADLPFVWKSPESFWKTLNGPLGDEILDKLTARGLKGLAWGSIGARGWINNGYVINTPEDMRRKKIRVIQSPFYVKMIESFGASPTPISFTEVYTAFQQRTVDSVDASYSAFISAKLEEVGTSLTVSNHILSALVAVTNGPRFNALTPEQKKILVDSARAGAAVGEKSVNEATTKAIEKMRAKGLTITVVKPEAFAAKVQPVYDYFAERVGSKDLINRIKAAQQ